MMGGWRQESTVIEMKMTGRAAIVTGGSKGIGLAIATNYVRAGAGVAIVARTRSELDRARDEIAKAGTGKVVAIAADIRTAPDCSRAFGEAEAALGQIDVLVNNAGVSTSGAFEAITDEVWQQDFDLKLFAAIRFARLALPGMKARRWGRIINVLNVGAKAPKAGSAPTTVTRAAGLALTKGLANEGAPHNVLVNSLHVGWIESDQWVRRHAAEGKGRSYDAYRAEIGSRIPLGRMGTAEEFANIATFLASDAGSYVTGTAINVDGGVSPVT